MNHQITVSALCLSLVLQLAPAIAYRTYQAQIPNGARVTNPCNNLSDWEGVGHQTREGGSTRNPFGHDFSANGHTWTKDLCLRDSDGDGHSNGEELGDPNCTWVPGAATLGPPKSHPGVCEPQSSPACATRNSWLDCSKGYKMDQSVCAGIDNKTTFSKDLLLNPTIVPGKETTYFCQIFDLNVTSDLHMIATQPLITASDVVHHILLFGCNPKTHMDSELRSPYPCDMVPHEACRSLIGAWTVGSPGECAHPDMGFKVGPNGYRTVAIQIHWNNPSHIEGIRDNSGLRIHLTSSLRKHDAGMLVVGQQFLQIEPSLALGEATGPDMRFSASCPGRCTKFMFDTPIHITSAVNHMHYLGKSQEIKVYNNGSLINIITDQINYDYDSPLIYTFSEPIKINPGDEIRTTCVYKRSPRPDPVCWGEATSQEMCFGFITYYPLQSLSHPWCTSMDNFPSCDRHLPGLNKQPIDGCRWWEFRNSSDPENVRMMSRIIDKCYSVKQESLTCTAECRELTRKIADHRCLKGDAGSYMIDKFKQAGPAVNMLLDAVITCSCRTFSYCDRKKSQGFLGSRQTEFCSSAGNSVWTHLWLITFVAIWRRYL